MRIAYKLRFILIAHRFHDDTHLAFDLIWDRLISRRIFSFDSDSEIVIPKLSLRANGATDFNFFLKNLSETGFTPIVANRVSLLIKHTHSSWLIRKSNDRLSVFIKLNNGSRILRVSSIPTVCDVDS